MRALSQNLARSTTVLALSGKLGRRRNVIGRWLTVPLGLWTMLWLSINSGPWNLSEFGNGLTGSINGVRAAFPLIVCATAFVSLSSRKYRRTRGWTEIGFWIYGIIITLACTGAEGWFSQAYWGFAFVGTLAAAEHGLRTEDPLEFISKLNWLSWLITTLALVTMLFLARNVLYAPGTSSAYGVINRFQEAYGYGISRATGLSRMAAVPAIIALVFLFLGNAWHRALSLGIFLGAFYVIWIMQARGALFSFVGAFLFVMFFGGRRQRNLATLLTIALVLFASAGTTFQGAIHDIWFHATRDEGSGGFSSMSRRIDIWRELLERWSESPVFGYGPQADRLFAINAQNALIYALLCGGVVGATSFAVAMGAAWNALFSIVLAVGRLPRRERIMFQITGAILVFSTLRSYPENEAAVFSVDLLLQYPAMVYLSVLCIQLTRSKKTLVYKMEN